MFNFIFESSLGNILAPVKSAVCQFHLAIQHNRIDEINAAIGLGTVPLGDVQDTGYADVHVACRYNNRFALELLLNRGVPKDLVDKYGNTTVHYCSKYGNLDLCRWLIEMGCSPVARNMSGQTPYDVADNHLVRQYLLPLQFRDSSGAEYVGAGGPSTQQPVAPMESSPLYEAANSLMAPRPAYPTYGGGSYAPGNQMMPPYPGVGGGVPVHSASSENLAAPHAPAAALAPPAVPPPQGSGSGRSSIAGGVVVNKMPPSTRLHTNSSPSPHEGDSSSPISGTASSMESLQPPPSVPFLSPQQSPALAASTQWAPPPAAGTYWPPTANAPAKKRVITPDGFGSSASDPALQKKYGNVIDVKNTAPPPMFGPPGAGVGYSMSSGPPCSGSDVPPFPGGNLAAPTQNPYSMPNPYSSAPPVAPPRPLGSSSNNSSSNSLQYNNKPDVFNPNTDVNISVEASSTSSAIL